MTSHTSDPTISAWWRSNAFVAMFLSALVPGLGQLYAGRRRRGFVLLAITGLALIILLVMLRDRSMWLTWSVQPTALRWLLAGNGVLLAFRLWAAADALAVAGDPWQRISDRVGVAVGAFLVVASLAVVGIPHAVAGYYDLVQYDFITTVFAPTPTLPPALPPVATTAPAPPPTTPGQTLAPGETVPPTVPPTTTTSTIPPRIWDGTERLNVLLLGGDGGTGRTSIRTDTIILASIDPESGHTALFSVPRNMALVPMPAEIEVWDCDCFPGIINALWRWADDRPGRFPDLADPGADVLKLAIGTMVDLPIHYYALINLVGFIDLVDAIGGVDITVPTRVRDEYSGPNGTTEIIDLQPGEYHFDGYQTLGYVRVRKATSDYNRMSRQRCVLRAIARQADPVTVIRAFPDIANVLKNNLFTDIPLERLPEFIELIPKIKADEIVSVQFVPSRFTGPRTPDRYPTPDLDEIRSVVDEVLAASSIDVVEELDLEDLEKACG
jgi:LCP family protein required for cell wall assembly